MQAPLPSLHVTPLRSTARHVASRHNTTLHDKALQRELQAPLPSLHPTTRHATTRYDTTRHDKALQLALQAPLPSHHPIARHLTTRHASARHDTTQHDMLSEIRIRIPFVPHSLKNGVRIGNGMMRRSPQIRREQESMRALILQTVRKAYQGPGLPWPEDEVEVEATRDVKTETFEVVFRHAGPKPKGRTGRNRDTQNLLESLLDAAEGIVYSNDNQVSTVTIRRTVLP